MVQDIAIIGVITSTCAFQLPTSNEVVMRQKHFRNTTFLMCGNTHVHIWDYLCPPSHFLFATLEILIAIWLGSFLPDDLWFKGFCFLRHILQCPNQQSVARETSSPIYSEHTPPANNTLQPSKQPLHNLHMQSTLPKVDLSECLRKGSNLANIIISE